MQRGSLSILAVCELHSLRLFFISQVSGHAFPSLNCVLRSSFRRPTPILQILSLNILLLVLLGDLICFQLRSLELCIHVNIFLLD